MRVVSPREVRIRALVGRQQARLLDWGQRERPRSGRGGLTELCHSLKWETWEETGIARNKFASKHLSL